MIEATPEHAATLNRKEEALWLFQRLLPDCAVDNLSWAVGTSATVEHVLLAAAVTELTRRHPTLRTVFPARHGTPARRTLEPGASPPPLSAAETTRDGLPDLLTALAGRPFDLTTELPFRVTRIAVREGGTVLCLVVHHIAFDGRSAGIVLPELTTIYLELAGLLDQGVAGQPAGLREPAPSPAGLRYWTDRTAGIDLTALPLDRARSEPTLPTFAGARIHHDLTGRTRIALDTLRTRLRVTDNMVLLAAYLLLLARHGAGPDLLVAVPVDARRRDTAGSVGFHVNTLPLRVTVDPRAGFRTLAADVRERLVTGLAHADVSFESLLGELGLDTMTWRAPLFRHMFNFLPTTTVVSPGPLPDAAWVPTDSGLSRYDLHFVVLRWPGRIELQAVYSTEIHDEAYVRALVDRYELLLRAAAADPDRPVADLDLWHPDERALVDRVNATEHGPVPTVPRLIADRMRHSPGHCALIEPEQHRDHGWLDTRAAALRHHLAAAGVTRGDIVAVSVPRGADLAAAVLATWSLGAAYLPVDPTQPADRLRARLDAADARVLLIDGPGPDGATLRLDLLGPVPDQPSIAAHLAGIGDDDLAYVIFTSGSTGQPKGVEITHGALANLIAFFAGHLDVTDRDRTLWLTSFGFDISALELFLALGHGGGAVVAPDVAQVRPDLLLDLVTRHDVAIVQTTPTIWRLVAGRLDRELADRRVLCGGEPLSAALAERLLAAGCRLFNVYGPTETTIWSTVAEIHPGGTDPIGIGRPIWRTTVDVADPDGRPVPPGVVGELRIGGAGVARGYLGQPELTAERFRHDPVLGRHYRTGDLATWRPDGTVELLGRADRQVKLRGRRIELGEIEAALERHPAVAAAAVVVHGDPQGDGRLVGYLQPAPDARVDRADITRFAGTVLPHHLVPADLVVLDALPRNASGKVDHHALPEVVPDRGPAPAGAAGPTADPLVDLLTGLWSDLLGRADLHADSNFFAAGGQSLLAAVLAARVGEHTGREVSLQDVFTAPTPHELAKVIQSTEETHAN